MPTTLTPADLSNLEEDWIDQPTVEADRIYRVSSHEGAEMFGQRANEDYAGIVFHGFWPGDENPRVRMLRRDNPPLEKNSDGILKPIRKYLNEPGRGNRLSFGPEESPEDLKDVQVPFWMTEGPKQLCVLRRLARHKSKKPRAVACAINGVYGYRGTIGKVVNSNGKRVDEKGVISDIDRVVWAGREVVILFDSDAATNEKVAAARRGLVAELTRRGARVAVVDLPTLDGQDKTGIDDFLAERGPEEALQLIEKARTSATTDGPEQGRRSQATCLIELAAEADLWHTPDGDAYATVYVDDHHEHHRLRQKTFRQWLAQQYFRNSKGAPSAQALSDALAVLEAQAQFDGDEQPVYVRLAEYDGVIYLDLANQNWEAVAISATGWQVVMNPPVAFRRTRGMLPLPTPQDGGSVTRLKRHINLDANRENDWILLVACLLAMFRPRGPYPVIILHGEQGSAKSTLVRILRMLLDPNKSLLRSAPRDGRDLMISAANSWVLAYDNLSHLEPWLSDAFCRLSTGGGLSTRELYTDSEELILEAQRPVIINGIEELATRGDLLDRGLLFYLPTITKENRQTEADLWQQFDQDRPYILGAILDAVCGAMRDLASTKLESLPRLADFATWATAAEKTLGWAPRTFMNAYTANQKDANDITLEASPITGPLRKVLEMQTSKPSWTGTATDLLKALNGQVDEQVRLIKSWPKSPRTLSNALRRLAPNLRAAQIEVDFSRANDTRSITLEDKGKAPSSASLPSSSNKTQGLSGDDTHDGTTTDDDANDAHGDVMTHAESHATSQNINGSVDHDDHDAQIPLPSDEEVVEL